MTIFASWTGFIPSSILSSIIIFKLFNLFNSCFTLKRRMVELRGFEPLASSMPRKRAPSCATAPREYLVLYQADRICQYKWSNH